MIWLYGIAGTPYEISINRSPLEVRTALSARLHLPISVLEIKKEGLAILNTRSFQERLYNNSGTDCACCGDGPDEGVFPVEPESPHLCSSCCWSEPLCIRCMRTSGLEKHCARCLGDIPDDWSKEDDIPDDIQGLRRHWGLMNYGGQQWCQNIVRLYDTVDALEQEMPTDT